MACSESILFCFLIAFETNQNQCALWPPARKGLTSKLAFVVYICEFVTFPSVSWSDVVLATGLSAICDCGIF